MNEINCYCGIEVNTMFVYPFALAMFFSVMIFGHTQANMEPVNNQLINEFNIVKTDKRQMWFL